MPWQSKLKRANLYLYAAWPLKPSQTSASSSTLPQPRYPAQAKSKAISLSPPLSWVTHFGLKIPANNPPGRIVFVIESFGEAAVQGQEKLHPVTKLDVPEQEGDDSLYRLQVSGKRNHTYYVNVALKVLARRQWNTSLELSGLGNGTVHARADTRTHTNMTHDAASSATDK
jgi:hypothetical protein